MSTRIHFVALLLILMLSGLGAAAAAQEAGDPVIRLDSRSKVELDLGIMMDDLLPRFIDVVAEEDPEDAEMFRHMLELIGMDALDRIKSETKQTRDHSTCEFELTLDPERSETLLYRMLTTPNGSCDFARHVSRDEVVMFVTLHNFPHYLGLVLDFMATPEIVEMAGDMPVNAEGELDLGGFVPRTDLLPLLSGELDFFFLDPGDEVALNPMAAPYFMVLGATDGFALRDRILEIAAMSGGGDFGAMLGEIEPEMVGGFELKVLPFGGALAVSEDYLVIGMAPDKMRDLLADRDGDLDVPDGIEWAYIDGPKYGAYMESIMAMAGMMAPEDAAETAWMMEIYDVLFDHMEYEEILYRSTDDGLEGSIEVRGPIMTGMYKMMVELLDKLPLIMAMQEDKDEGNDYRSAIMHVDEAMMAYAVDHDGYYPAAVTELLEEGYLEKWPFQPETPAGVFADWAYTYHTYPDEHGNIEGYILFLYGGSADAGYDVYTEENVAAEGPYELGADGMPDGVVSFCYDGVALEPVQEFFNQ
ncbi:MAG: hypothetical protein GY838_15140 [bacterium]|nr:hypothetical protein [bacterium]